LSVKIKNYKIIFYQPKNTPLPPHLSADCLFIDIHVSMAEIPLV
jgi:hypothetical protein